MSIRKTGGGSRYGTTTSNDDKNPVKISNKKKKTLKQGTWERTLRTNCPFLYEQMTSKLGKLDFNKIKTFAAENMDTKLCESENCIERSCELLWRWYTATQMIPKQHIRKCGNSVTTNTSDDHEMELCGRVNDLVQYHLYNGIHFTFDKERLEEFLYVIKDMGVPHKTLYRISRNNMNIAVLKITPKVKKYNVKGVNIMMWLQNEIPTFTHYFAITYDNAVSKSSQNFKVQYVLQENFTNTLHSMLTLFKHNTAYYKWMQRIVFHLLKGLAMLGAGYKMDGRTCVGFQHNNITLQNVMYSIRDKQPVVKFIDFQKVTQKGDSIPHQNPSIVDPLANLQVSSDRKTHWKSMFSDSFAFGLMCYALMTQDVDGHPMHVIGVPMSEVKLGWHSKYDAPITIQNINKLIEPDSVYRERFGFVADIAYHMLVNPFDKNGRTVKHISRKRWTIRDAFHVAKENNIYKHIESSRIGNLVSC